MPLAKWWPSGTSAMWLCSGLWRFFRVRLRLACYMYLWFWERFSMQTWFWSCFLTAAGDLDSMATGFLESSRCVRWPSTAGLTQLGVLLQLILQMFLLIKASSEVCSMLHKWMLLVVEAGDLFLEVPYFSILFPYLYVFLTVVLLESLGPLLPVICLQSLCDHLLAVSLQLALQVSTCSLSGLQLYFTILQLFFQLSYHSWLHSAHLVAMDFHFFHFFLQGLNGGDLFHGTSVGIYSLGVCGPSCGCHPLRQLFFKACDFFLQANIFT